MSRGGSTATPESLKMRAEIRTLLSDGVPRTTYDIADALTPIGVGQFVIGRIDTFNYNLRKMEDAGEVLRAKRGQYWSWRIAPPVEVAS